MCPLSKAVSGDTGTIYEKSNIPLQKWFLTFYVLSASKKGISSCELAKIIGVTTKKCMISTAKNTLHALSCREETVTEHLRMRRNVYRRSSQGETRARC